MLAFFIFVLAVCLFIAQVTIDILFVKWVIYGAIDTAPIYEEKIECEKQLPRNLECEFYWKIPDKSE